MITFGTKAKVFKDPARQQELNEQGYTVVPFLTPEEVATSLAMYQGFYPEGVKGFYATTFARDIPHRFEVDEKLRAMVHRGIEQHCENYKVFCSSFIVKAPGPKSELKLHQDMTLVDENNYTGINIWVPLVDLNDQNGAIEVLPRSHRLFPTYRGAALPDIYDGLEREVHSYLQPLYLKAGEAVIFDQSIIHYSPPNFTDEDRPVINTFITHQEARIRIAWTNRETHPNEVELFEQEDDFSMNFQNFGHDIFKRPVIGTSLGFVPYDFPKLSVPQLEAAYGPLKLPPVETPSQEAAGPVLQATAAGTGTPASDTHPGLFKKIWHKLSGRTRQHP